jgi:hypothetical protein
MIIISALFLRLFTSNFARAITLFPFIILNSRSLQNEKIIITHERIHLKQQLELLVLPFYLWYLLEFLFWWIRKKDFREAYENIVFEREAFAHQERKDYLKQRPFWAFFRHYGTSKMDR